MIHRQHERAPAGEVTCVQALRRPDVDDNGSRARRPPPRRARRARPPVGTDALTATTANGSAMPVRTAEPSAAARSTAGPASVPARRHPWHPRCPRRRSSDPHRSARRGLPPAAGRPTRSSPVRRRGRGAARHRREACAGGGGGRGAPFGPYVLGGPAAAAASDGRTDRTSDVGDHARRSPPG